MEPLTLAAIYGGTKLLEGILGSRAQRQRNLMEDTMSAMQQQTKAEQEAISGSAGQQQNALANVIEAYRTALLGG